MCMYVEENPGTVQVVSSATPQAVWAAKLALVGFPRNNYLGIPTVTGAANWTSIRCPAKGEKEETLRGLNHEGWTQCRRGTGELYL